MKKLISFWRIAETGLKNLLRNAWLSTAATAVMVVTLTLLLSGWMVNMALNATITQVSDKIDISIFLEDNIPEDRRQELASELLALENVREVNYVSKADALARYREQNRDNPELLEAVTDEENPLPASFGIRVYDLDDIEPILGVAGQEKYQGFVDPDVDEDRRITIQRIAGASNFIVQTSIGASVIFAVISILIIFNTIRLAIFTRGEEIQIMRLIGATNSFIRGPFLFEAAFYGLVAAGIALAVSYSALLSLGPKVATHIDFFASINYFTANWLLVGFVTVAAGIMIGIFSSLLAMVRYLKL